MAVGAAVILVQQPAQFLQHVLAASGDSRGFKQARSFWPVHSPLTVVAQIAFHEVSKAFVIALYFRIIARALHAVALTPIQVIRLIGKRVTSHAVRFCRVRYDWIPFRSKRVLATANQAQMRRVAAPRIVAGEMIELWDSRPDTSRDRLDQPRVHQPVREFQAIVKTRPPVFACSHTARPIPAPTLRNVDALKKADDVAKWQMRNDQITVVHHGGHHLNIVPYGCHCG